MSLAIPDYASSTTVTQAPAQVREIGLSGIAVIPGRLRALRPEVVDELAESMRRQGLLQPILVRPSEATGYYLVVGRHRLEAAKKLKWRSIPALVLNDVEAVERLLRVEISENLHRAELTALERADHIKRWMELAAGSVAGRPEGVQVARPSPGGEQPHDKGISLAAKKLNLDRREVQRSLKVASITPEAKVAAKAAGIADNQSKLLEVAAAPAKEQMEGVRAAFASLQSARKAKAERNRKARERREAKKAEERAAREAENAAEKAAAEAKAQHLAADLIKAGLARRVLRYLTWDDDALHLQDALKRLLNKKKPMPECLRREAPTNGGAA